MRIGMGYDVHRLVLDRPLILGGVKIKHPLGLLGHSDADVLIHAIMDALLGALALGDIGKHFPDTEKAYENIDSLLLLKKVGDLVNEKNYIINNIDATIIAQEPKLAPYIEAMVENIEQTLNLAKHCVSVKATTEEGLGFTGGQLGIAANAVVSVVKGELTK
ncbi:2-C-methyl-D-erythritol 2,4-cyclodiphosphate synthase [Acetobacterium bakii]|uniref:2-C-methyl-D-erythritol 2,4-cyclodiphosphate synthase n=1 Tax=Acetobacterium bakii TaxID=52689 RepID=A0A0L6TVJ1_9FIRM|nr:2-C-methyl-D-erythritol 2,4-cyclodiphosphate synthase [Acetobacterium bakii]KNZ40289.1 2-C-methyl-D-erythritol 2,4-cyclodiphosphate synthase [Acetobacterium bakii]